MATQQAKRCYRCGATKPLADFPLDRSRVDGHGNRCRVCHNAASAQYSKTKAARMRRATRERNYRGQLHALLDQARVKGCSICGEEDGACLDFHHLDPVKKRSLPKHITRRTATPNPSRRELIKRDVEGCALLCRNCHAKLHAGRFPGIELKPITFE